MTKQPSKKKASTKKRKFTRQEPYVLHGDRQKWVLADEAETRRIYENKSAVPNVDYLTLLGGAVLVPA